MKLDKDTLLKHRFWIALGAFVVVWLVVLVLMPLQIGASAAAKRTEYYNAKSAVEKIKQPKTDFANTDWVAPLKKKEEELKSRKEKVWQKAWQTQVDLMTWPGDDHAPLDQMLKDAYFLDPIKNPEWRDRYATTLYAPQYAEFKNAIFPAYYNGGSYEAILRPVTTWSGPSGLPDSDECWFAQEDLWVKRDLIGAIRDAIDTASVFKADPIDAKKEAPPAGAVARYRFHNDNWELTLILEPDKDKKLTISPKSTVKNINRDRRRLAVAAVGLAVAQQAKSGAVRGPVTFSLEGEPLEYGKVAELKKPVVIDTFKADEPLEVHQVFNWYTSPVKRLDRLELATRAAESHRMAKYALQTKSSGPKDENAAATPPAAGGTGGGAGGTGGAGGPAGMSAPPPGLAGGGDLRGGLGAMGGTPAAAGVERNRYLDLSDQVRRMPVGLVLVVDQARIPDVLTALTNSRLHIWVTQWEWQHTQGVQPPAKPEPSSDEEGGDTREGATRPGPLGSGMRPPGTGGTGPAAGSMRPPGLGGTVGGGLGGPKMGSGMGPPPGMRPPAMGGTGGGLMPPIGGMGGFGRLGGLGGTGGFRPGFFGGSPEAAGLEAEDPNLVELTVYGIASLYERYPPKAAAGDSPAATK
jgi:hypothetical protein